MTWKQNWRQICLSLKARKYGERYVPPTDNGYLIEHVNNRSNITIDAYTGTAP